MPHKISKLDAARRQLEMAINLYFFDRDFVSVHTLAAASFRLLSDLLEHHDVPYQSMNERVLEYVKAEFQEEFLRSVKQAENFFKHADRDPEEILTFDPRETEFLLWDAVVAHHALVGDTPPLLRAFHIWFIVQNPTLFRLPTEMERARAAAERVVKTTSKQEAFEALVKMALQLPRPFGSIG